MPSRHHLQLMKEESDLFMSLFKSGIFYLEGGVDSGFRHVAPTVYEHKLYHVKGKRYPRVSVVEMKADSINEGDVFILDLGMKLYFWPGKDCNIHEKTKGMEIFANIKNTERGAHPEVFYPRDNTDFENDFWEPLGGKPSQVKPAIPDEGFEEGMVNDPTFAYKLFKVSNESGTLEMTELTERPLKKDMLDPSDCFLLELHT